MPAELVIAPEAELDITEAYVWYEGRRAGLGEEFPVLSKRVLSVSGADPRCTLSFTRPTPFPDTTISYAVFYESSEALVTIYAVFHTSRSPDKWRQRLF
jgi:hypothetical protein